MDGKAKDYTLQVILAWLLVGIPLLWGVYITLHNSLPLFGGGAGGS
ncbi:MAG TPA: hypothetical protein VHE77_15730 [Dongiaceae bacterium]|jgi:hypothetical protein|nr:hypothetical protein [Dongiaceae bacterium]